MTLALLCRVSLGASRHSANLCTAYGPFCSVLLWQALKMGFFPPPLVFAGWINIKYSLRVGSSNSCLGGKHHPEQHFQTRVYFICESRFFSAARYRLHSLTSEMQDDFSVLGAMCNRYFDMLFCCHTLFFLNGGGGAGGGEFWTFVVITV